ncbi:MAG: hypothetical protein ACK5SA_14415 [Planctomycetota bacterium]
MSWVRRLVMFAGVWACCGCISQTWPQRAFAWQAEQKQALIDRKLADLAMLPKPEAGDWLIEPVERKAGVFRTETPGELALDNGLVRRTFLLQPNLGCVGLQNLQTGREYVRAIRPEARVQFGDRTYDIGGLQGQPVGNFLRTEWFGELRTDSTAFQLESCGVGPIRERFGWKPRREWIAGCVPAWPAAGLEVQFVFSPPVSTDGKSPSMDPAIRVVVHYELYDGLPLISKWIRIVNSGDTELQVSRFTSEILATVEASSQVEDLAEPFLPLLHVETDFTTCSMEGTTAQVDAVHWSADPSYETQVNYRKETKCLLECRPPMGPDRRVAPGGEFQSFRTWLLPLESRDETRRMLALGRMYRAIAPWVLENPLIHHVRSAEPAAVRLAIDQSAEVGFELVIMTFGSGFQIENDSAQYLAAMRELTAYAHSKGVGLGGYSLLASRSEGERHDVVNPQTGKPGGFARFGNSPCLESEWGQAYFAKLYKFFEQTESDVLEHDGSYPGDACASTVHPGHRGYEDSRWEQWERITSFYQWCRGRGVYLNVPDWYFLHGSNKNGMGYRETNWSLPREWQEIIERQNIHDGTRYKLPTMGWMFVPLTEYHGGGAAATIEPLAEHLDHYERRLENLLGAGVQACFRGPRLYDTDRTREMVARQVAAYKADRAILDSPLIPLRRADGRDWDGWLHVNPELKTPALAVLYNPLATAVEREIEVPLLYSGLVGECRYQIGASAPQTARLDRGEKALLQVVLPPRSATRIKFWKVGAGD